MRGVKNPEPGKMIMMNAIVALTLALTASAAWSAELEIKGLKPGMSTSELKQLYPTTRCASEQTGSKKGIRCVLKKFTIANHEAKAATLRLYDDQLIEMRFEFYDVHKGDLMRALTGKFGQPQLGALQNLEWRFAGDTSINVESYPSSPFYLSVLTPQSREMRRKASGARAQSANSDI